MINLSQAADLYKVFRAGESVVDTVRLKNVQNFGNAVAVLLGAALLTAKAFGHAIPITDDQLTAFGSVAATLFGLFNVGATTASTKSIGLLPRKTDASEAAGETEPTSETTELQIPTESEVQSVSRTSVSTSGVLDGLDTTYCG